MGMASEEVSFELWQDDVPVVDVDAPDEERAWREICHYAAQCRQDGPVEIKRVVRTTVAVSEGPSCETWP